MNCLELFAGAGGAALGLRQAGFKSVCLVERDEQACKTLRAAGHSPVLNADVRNIPAIRKVVGATPVQVIWSSFPCQAWSSAGRRKGAADERNGWPWTLDCIDEFKPQWLLAENVRGLTMHKPDCGFNVPEACAGCYLLNVIMPSLQRRFWSCGYWVLDAADYGVPQHRRRIIIWAGPRELQAPPATHGPGKLPHVSMGRALGLGGSILGRNKLSVRNVELLNKPSTTVIAGEYKGSFDAYRGNGIKKKVSANDFLWAATGRLRLTRAECARLQGFPDGYPFQGTVESQYRQIGNAVPPALSKNVGLMVINK